MESLYKLSFLMLWAIPACTSDNSITETDPDLGYQTTYHLDPKSGIHHGPYTKTDSTGILLESGYLDQGQPSGIRELYYANGNVKIRERYKSGQLDDLYEYFFTDGRHELKGYYVHGAMYGLWRKYAQEGHLLEEVTMINNEEMGPFKEYHPNGRIQAEGMYLHGPNEDGVLKLYDESGQLQKEMFCHAGRCYTVWPKG